MLLEVVLDISLKKMEHSLRFYFFFSIVSFRKKDGVVTSNNGTKSLHESS